MSRFSYYASGARHEQKYFISLLFRTKFGDEKREWCVALGAFCTSINLSGAAGETFVVCFD
jgi:hypothetical protein